MTETLFMIYSAAAAAVTLWLLGGMAVGRLRRRRRRGRDAVLQRKYLHIVMLALFSGGEEVPRFPLLRRAGARRLLIETVGRLVAATYGLDPAPLRRIVVQYGLDGWLLRRIRFAQGYRRARYLMLLSRLPAGDGVGVEAARYIRSRNRYVRFYALMTQLAAEPATSLRRMAEYDYPFSACEVSEIMAMLRRGLLPIAYEPLVGSPNRNLRMVGLGIVRQFGIEEAERLLLAMVARERVPELGREALYTLCSMRCSLRRREVAGRIASMMDRMGLKEGEVIQAGMMTRAIERAQKKVEENNFGIRKRLLEYDDVMNSQREVIYTRRRHALYGERIEIDLNNIMYDYADNFVETNRGIEFEDFRFELIREVAVEPSFGEETYGSAKPAELVELIVKDLKETYARRAKAVADTVRPVMERIYEDKKDQLDSNIYFPITDGHLGYNVPVNLLKCKNTDGAEIYKIFSKVVMFTTIDDAWREHLREMDDLRQSVQNATYEQKDPLLIYKFESFGLFSKMIVKVNRDVLSILNKAYIPVRDQNAEAVQRQRQERAKVDVNKLQASRMQAAAQAGQQDKQKPMPMHVEKKVGRNDPCPCGSGKKYKQCHGKGM